MFTDELHNETRLFLGCKKQKSKIIHPRLNLSNLFTCFVNNNKNIVLLENDFGRYFV